MSATTEATRNPRFTSVIDWQDFNCKISKYFTVGEVTRYDVRRIPRPGSIEAANILRLAQELDKIRHEWGAAIGVTSWYRPYEINLAVGGVSNSQHITGSAVDIYTMDGRDDKFEVFLDEYWCGALGYGVRSGLGFTHLDMRNGRWKHSEGELIRWMY